MLLLVTLSDMFWLIAKIIAAIFLVLYSGWVVFNSVHSMIEDVQYNSDLKRHGHPSLGIFPIVFDLLLATVWLAPVALILWFSR